MKKDEERRGHGVLSRQRWGQGWWQGGSHHPGAPQDKGAAARQGAARCTLLGAETLPGRCRWEEAWAAVAEIADLSPTVRLAE